MLCPTTASLGKRTLAVLGLACGRRRDRPAGRWPPESCWRCATAESVCGLLGLTRQSDPGWAQGHRTLVRSIRLRRCHGAGGRHPGQERPVVLDSTSNPTPRGCALSTMCGGRCLQLTEHPCILDDPPRPQPKANCTRWHCGHRSGVTPPVRWPVGCPRPGASFWPAPCGRRSAAAGVPAPSAGATAGRAAAARQMPEKLEQLLAQSGRPADAWEPKYPPRPVPGYAQQGHHPRPPGMQRLRREESRGAYPTLQL